MHRSEVTPTRYKNLLDYLFEHYSGSNLRPPLLIRGEAGTGKSWMLKALFDRLEEKSTTTTILPIAMPLQLNAESLVLRIKKRIEKGMSKVLHESLLINQNLRYVIFMEDIDKIYSVKSALIDKGHNSAGRLAPIFAQLQHASELRRFLIEKSNKTTIVASCGLESTFIEDPKQPFFEFFNVIDLDPLDNSECIEYLKNKLNRIRMTSLAGSGIPLEEVLGQITSFWAFYLTDGRLSHLNLLADTIVECETNLGDAWDGALMEFFRIYFRKIAPFCKFDLDRLTYTEKLLIDRISILPNDFAFSKIDVGKYNLSKYMLQLKEKRIISGAGKGTSARFKMTSNALKCWLRFYKQCDLIEMLSPQLEASMR